MPPKKQKHNKKLEQELQEDGNRLTGGQYIDADLNSPEAENKHIKTDDGTKYEKPNSERSKSNKKPFVLQCNAKDGQSLRSSQKGNKLFENENQDVIQPLYNNDDMEFNPAINADAGVDSERSDVPDPETFWEQLQVVTKLAVGPIISMVFQQLV